MAAKEVADRPHTITIVLSLLAASITALGVYFTYQKSKAPAEEQHTETTHQKKPPTPKPSQIQPTAALKQCSGTKSIAFTPNMPGVMQTTPDGQRIDLGDGGGGTRLQEWKVSWTAPAKVTAVDCATGRNQNKLGPPSKVGSTAECIGSINGGSDAITLTVTWDGPCDKQ